MEQKDLKGLLIEQRKRFEDITKPVIRDKLSRIKQLLELPHILVISGLRRSGKSTLLQEIKQNLLPDMEIYYITFEDERLLNFKVDDFQMLYETFIELYGKQKIFFMDEIQNIPQWEVFVRRMHDQGLKFIVTGSNSSMLSKELGSRLTGRHIPIELYPFSFKEFLIFKETQPNDTGQLTTEEKVGLKKLFDEYLEKGGIPEFLIHKNAATLQSLYNNILYRDVLGRHDIADEKSLRELSSYVFSNCGKEFSYNRLKTMLNLGSPNTVKNYISFLEESYLVFTIPQYNPSLKKQIYSNKKGYVIDTGLINLISFRTSKDAGRVLENVVFLELKRAGKEIYFYKEKNECDFLIRERAKIVQAIQVTQTMKDQKTRKREVSGLLDALKRFHLKEGLILTEDEESEETIEGRRITIRPIWKWLLDKKEIE